VTTEAEKPAKVSQWPTTTTIQEVQQFLGLASYYRYFVKNFATIAKPLHKLTECGKQFAWTSECEYSFALLKQHLTSAPVLVFPDYTETFILILFCPLSNHKP